MYSYQLNQKNEKKKSKNQKNELIKEKIYELNK